MKRSNPLDVSRFPLRSLLLLSFFSINIGHRGGKQSSATLVCSNCRARNAATWKIGDRFVSPVRIRRRIHYSIYLCQIEGPTDAERKELITSGNNESRIPRGLFQPLPTEQPPFLTPSGKFDSQRSSVNNYTGRHRRWTTNFAS